MQSPVYRNTEPQFKLKFAVVKWAMCEQAGRKAKAEAKNEKKEN